MPAPIVLVSAFAVLIAGAASALPRALPPSADFEEMEHGVESPIDEVPQTIQDVTFNSIYALQSLQEDGETVDILVTPYLFGFNKLMDQQQDIQMKMQRLSMPSLTSILPHFNSSCSCEQWKCSCCATVEIPPLRRNKTACANVAYISEKLAIQLRLSINNRTFFERDLISGSSPPPFCFPPIPQIPVVTVCMRLSNISLLTEDAKVQACASMEVGLIFTSPLIRLRFGCLKIGRGGVAWSSTPSAQPVKLTAVNDAQTALHQFAAVLNSTENEQLQLLQSILRQQSVYEQSATTQPSRNLKMAWSTILPRNPRNIN